MTQAAAIFINDLLASAKDKHGEAIAAVEARPIDLDRVKAADGSLADAILLVEDALDTLGDMGAGEHAATLEGALTQLHHQRGLLADGIAQYDMAQALAQQTRQKPSLWPWAIFGLMMFAVVQVLA